MASRDEIRATIVDDSGLDEIELLPTTKQLEAIANGCIANSLSNLTTAQKDGLRKAVSEVEGDLAEALDKIKKRRSRMVIQKDRLNDKKKEIEGGAAKISALYVYGGPAINACPNAADAARLAKEGSDLVHARLNEIEYQLSLIDAQSLVLGDEERELSKAMAALDEMVISLR